MNILSITSNKYFPLNLFIIFIFWPSITYSQIIHDNLSTKELFSNCINEYNNINDNLEKILPELKKIKFNFIIKIHLSKLKKFKNNLNSNIVKINKKIDGKNYNETKLFYDIKELSKNIKIFDEKYNKTITIYYKFEKTKNSLYKFFKVFFISLFIGIVFFAIFIFIITIIVIKKQKKYYELKEEVTLTQSKEIDIKNKRDILPKNDKTNLTSFRYLIRKDLKFIFPKMYNKKNKS